MCTILLDFFFKVWYNIYIMVDRLPPWLIEQIVKQEKQAEPNYQIPLYLPLPLPPPEEEEQEEN